MTSACGHHEVCLRANRSIHIHNIHIYNVQHHWYITTPRLRQLSRILGALVMNTRDVPVMTDGDGADLHGSGQRNAVHLPLRGRAPMAGVPAPTAALCAAHPAARAPSHQPDLPCEPPTPLPQHARRLTLCSTQLSRKVQQVISCTASNRGASTCLMLHVKLCNGLAARHCTMKGFKYGCAIEQPCPSEKILALDLADSSMWQCAGDEAILCKDPIQGGDADQGGHMG